MAYFTGYGYSDEFSANMAGLLARLRPDSPVGLVVGTDEVCGACPNNSGGICNKPEQVAGYDRAVLAACGLAEGTVLPFGQFTALVQKRILETGRRTQICGNCQWNGICTSQTSRFSQSSLKQADKSGLDELQV